MARRKQQIPSKLITDTEVLARRVTNVEAIATSNPDAAKHLADQQRAVQEQVTTLESTALALTDLSKSYEAAVAASTSDRQQLNDRVYELERIPPQIGPQGPPGAPGEQGVPGIAGSPGERGEMGPEGPRGEPGTKGDTGMDGVPGVQGIRGLIGPAGERGTPGPKGEPGIQGVPGDPGPAGPPGTMGPPGGPGANGVKGDPGPKGDRGEQGLKGDKGDKGDTGPQGIPGVTNLILASGSVAQTLALASGTSINHVIALNKAMPNTDYQATATLIGGVNVLGSVRITGITTKTTTTITVNVAINGLSSLLGSSYTIECIAIKAT